MWLSAEHRAWDSASSDFAHASAWLAWSGGTHNSGRSVSQVWDYRAVDIWEYDGRLFEVVMCSDVVRDGMALELTALDSKGGGPSLEAFWHDDGTGFEFIAHRAESLPFELVERFVSRARQRLPPTGP